MWSADHEVVTMSRNIVTLTMNTNDNTMVLDWSL